MPAKNRNKFYIEDSYYHVYNRGVEKRNIFLDQKDYHVFLNLLKIYLLPITEAKTHLNKLFPEKRNRVRKTFYDEIELHAFCLMPNHFHLLLKQHSKNSMTEFIRSVCTSYSMYFNKRYKRVGSLFQGVYKAAHVMEDEYILHLSRYIHRNPLKLAGSDLVNLDKYPYSSLSTYSNSNQRPWVTTQFILNYFDSAKTPTLSYHEFVQSIDDDVEGLTPLTLEEDE